MKIQVSLFDETGCLKEYHSYPLAESQEQEILIPMIGPKGLQGTDSLRIQISEGDKKVVLGFGKG